MAYSWEKKKNYTIKELFWKQKELLYTPKISASESVKLKF